MVKQVEDKRPSRRSRYQRLRDSIKLPKFQSRIWDTYKSLKRGTKLIYKDFKNGIEQYNPLPGYTYRFNPSFLNTSFYDFETKQYKDECNTTITKHRKFIFGLFTITDELHSRNPSCGLKKTPLEEYEYQCEPSPECEGNGRAVYIWWRVNNYEYRDSMSLGTTEALLWFHRLTESTIESVTFPDNEFHDLSDDYNGEQILQVYATITTKQSFKYLANFKQGEGRRAEVEKDEEIKERTYQYHFYYNRANAFNLGNFGGEESGFGSGFATTNYSKFRRYKTRSYKTVVPQEEFFYPVDYDIAIHPSEKVEAVQTKTPFRTKQATPIDSYYDYFGSKIVQYASDIKHDLYIEGRTWVALTFCEDGTIHANNCLLDEYPPPPPKDMKCCPDNSDLLKQILKIVKQNKKAIGYDDYPVKVPSSLINVDGKESGSVDKESLTQLLAWYVERFDEIVGQFEIPIEIEDTDLIQEGNQSLKVKLPNIAEAIAEMFMMLMNLNITNEVQMNISTRLLAEAGADKQQNFKSYMALEAITEFLGFKYKDEIKKLPLTFTPGEESLSKILKEKEVDVSCIEYDDDMNLPKQMHELLQAAAITRAKNWRQLDTKGDIKKQLLDIILGNRDLIDNLTKNLDLSQLEKEINAINEEQNKE